jgi:hypothetical protein
VKHEALACSWPSQPERFAAGLPDFHDLLSRIVMDGRKGLESATAGPGAELAPSARATVAGGTREQVVQAGLHGGGTL